METNVIKFGGTSLGSAASIINAANIARSDGGAAVVVSAPGKDGGGKKITDLLYGVCARPSDSEPMLTVKNRFDGIVRSLGLDLDLSGVYKTVLRAAKDGDAMLAVSRGEYMSALIFSALTGYAFVDAASVIRFAPCGSLMKEETFFSIRAAAAKHKKIVVPGFYGSDGDGNIITFPRGGSDISGAVVAAALDADVYKNYTDVDGFMFADPKFDENSRVIAHMSYKQARFLAKHGAGVLCEGAIPYAADAGVAINVKNSFAPGGRGTVISDIPCRDEYFGVAVEQGDNGVISIAVGAAEPQKAQKTLEKIIKRLGGRISSFKTEECGAAFTVFGDDDIVRGVIREIS